jgi:parallel beta-helix repeat protein
VSRVLVADLKVDGNSANQELEDQMQLGIYLSSVTYSEVRNCWVENMRRGLGISLDSSSNNTITGNTCQGNGDGIFLYFSSYNNIVGNTIQGNDLYGIEFYSSSNNTVVGNSVLGNSQGSAWTFDGIYINYECDYNLISSNMIRHQDKQMYGINIASSDCDNNLVINNDLYQAGSTQDFYDAGTGTVYHNNRTTAGWVP